MKIVNATVTVKMTGVDGKEISIEKPVSYNEPESTDDVLTLMQGKKEDVDYNIGALAYGLNLKARAKVTQQIKAENQGPEVAINRAVKQIMSNREKFGKPITEEAARAQVLANAELFGIVLDSSVAA